MLFLPATRNGGLLDYEPSLRGGSDLPVLRIGDALGYLTFICEGALIASLGSDAFKSSVSIGFPINFATVRTHLLRN